MKECDYNIAFIGDCSQRPDGECVFLDNEGVPGGRIQGDLILVAFRRFSTDILQSVLKAMDPGNFPGEKCKAAPHVSEAISVILKERGESL
jgi:hypothetical protein